MRAYGFLSIITAALLFAGWAAEAQTPSTAPAPRKSIKLGVSGRPDQASLELALRRGYFADEGLDVETVQAQTGQEMESELEPPFSPSEHE